eukprot:maker-scaffold879_size85478-snap-gene-0.14 protein:Tk11981 transcript:maker-scaffold879_size85478-snap-gene-0.14-mRNA-1 annotation:"6-phosphogluconolactonase"
MENLILDVKWVAISLYAQTDSVLVSCPWLSTIMRSTALFLVIATILGHFPSAKSIRFITSGYSNEVETFSVDLEQNGTLSSEKKQAWDESLTFHTYDADSGSLYAIHEVEAFEGIQNSGALSRWVWDGVNQTLVRKEVFSVEGTGPCHVTLDKVNHILLAANYAGGSFIAFRVSSIDGSIQETIYTQQFEYGSGVVPDRQAGPHAHETVVQDDLVFVVDLGADRIYQYRIVDGELTPNGHAEAPPGAGPRHLAFAPSGLLGYVINELEMSVSVYELTNSTLSLLATVPHTVAGSDPAAQSGAEIQMGRDGKFLYISTRGEGALVVYEIKDASAGYLVQIQELKTQGDLPRHFTLTEEGRHLICGTQADANLVELYSVHPDTGMLEFLSSHPTIQDPTIITIIESGQYN